WRPLHRLRSNGCAHRSLHSGTDGSNRGAPRKSSRRSRRGGSCRNSRTVAERRGVSIGSMADDRTSQLAPAVRFLCLPHLGYFFVEFAIALSIASVALFADSIDFLEDASVNFLILIALGWSAVARARVGMVLAFLLLVPALATLWVAATKFMSPVPPAAVPL